MADETLGAAQHRSRPESRNESDPAGVLGSKLGDRYEVRGYLGGGGFSWVYRAWDDVLDINVAAKVMKGGASFSDEDFRREALLQAKFSSRHDNAVHVYGYGVDGGRPWLAMQLCEGRTLHDIIEDYRAKGERIPREMLLLFVEEMTKVLGAAHSDHLIHRDLKPNNIMLIHEGTPSQRFKLMDFGLSSKVDADMDATIRNYTKSSWGTPEYMSPEQIEALHGNDTASPQSDMYSLGVILYQILAGRVPFPLTDYSPLKVAECQLAVVQTPPEPPSKITEFGDIPPKAEQVVMECLSKKPDDRPRSMEEIRVRFLEAFRPSIEIPMTSLSLSRRKLVIVGTLFLGLLASLGVLAYALWRPQLSNDEWDFSFAQGTNRTVKVSIFRTNFDAPVAIELVPQGSAPVGVSYPSVIQFEKESSANLPIEVARDAALGEIAFDLKLVSENTSVRDDLKPMTLRITRPAPELPGGFRAAGGDESELQWIDNRPYYREIDCDVNGQQVRFVLVNYENTESSTRSLFYVMQRPVWVGLYEESDVARNAPPEEQYWKSAADNIDWEVTADQPVTNLSYQEAYDFAVWLSQLLPRDAESKVNSEFNLPSEEEIKIAHETANLRTGSFRALEERDESFYEFTRTGERLNLNTDDIDQILRPQLPFQKERFTQVELTGDSVFVYPLLLGDHNKQDYWDFEHASGYHRDRGVGFRVIVYFVE